MSLPRAFYGEAVATVLKPRCHQCDAVFAWYLTPPYSVQCRRCRAVNKQGDAPPSRRARRVVDVST